MSEPASSYERARWLAGQLNKSDAGAGFEFEESDLAIRSARTPAYPADQIELLGEIQSIIETFGRVLAELHRTLLDEAPFPRGWEALQKSVERAITNLDTSLLPDPYSRYSADELFTIWTDGRPETEDLVVCHGNPHLANVLLSGSRLGGLLDVGGLRIADRHLDLAVAHASIHARFGGDASYIFYDAYGTDPSLIKLDHYTLASHLLNHV